MNYKSLCPKFLYYNCSTKNNVLNKLNWPQILLEWFHKNKRDFMQKKEKGTKVESKWGKPYYIIDFRWNPTEEEHRQGVLL